MRGCIEKYLVERAEPSGEGAQGDVDDKVHEEVAQHKQERTNSCDEHNGLGLL